MSKKNARGASSHVQLNAVRPALLAETSRNISLAGLSCPSLRPRSAPRVFSYMAMREPAHIRCLASASSLRVMKPSSAPVLLPLGAAAKLATLRRLDNARSWTRIEDIRHCLGCGAQFSGREIQIFFFADGSPSLRAHCPTPDCEAPLSDWVWPRESVYIPGARERALQSPSHHFPSEVR